jgi:SRSO17 transposase
MHLCTLSIQDIKQCSSMLITFYNKFSKLFNTESAQHWGLKYLQGQLLCNKRLNIAESSRTVKGGNHQNMHHFISNSPWQDELIIAQIQKMVNASIGDSEDGALILDETGFTKKGKESVGVARQYNGNLGKIDNCQVGVFLAYSHENKTTLIDKRLYLPKKYAQNLERRRKCGVPDEISFQTKAQLGLDMILKAKEQKMKFGWTGFDSHYGEQPWLLDALNNEDIIYMGEVPCDTRVWLDNPPLTEIPDRKGSRGPHPKREKLVEGETEAIEVRQIERNITDDKWVRIKVRDGEKGPMIWDFAFFRVYGIRDTLPNDREEWLIIRKDIFDCNEIKYCLSNASEDTPIEKLASMVAQRFWVEKALKDAKGEAKLDEYQVRSWMGWHHHTTMTLLAMLFLLLVTLDLKGKAPMLTIQDVRQILEIVLPKRHFTFAEAIDLIETKHRQRLAAKKSHTKKRIENLNKVGL